MSDIERAISCLQNECGCAELDLSNGEYANTETAENFISSCKLAIEALEKQIPKQANTYTIPSYGAYAGQTGYICPVCGEQILASKFCPNCGQKLKRSEEND